MTSQAIESNRLSLVPFKMDDADELVQLFQDPEVRRFLLDGQLVDNAWVETEIKESRTRFRAGSIGIWSVRRQEKTNAMVHPGSIIGFSGFRPFFDPPELQLIYGLLPSAWGHGFATEAAHAAIRFATNDLRISPIVAATDVPNTASIAVMDRLGMIKTHTTEEGEHGTVFYRLPSSQPTIGLFGDQN